MFNILHMRRDYHNLENGSKYIIFDQISYLETQNDIYLIYTETSSKAADTYDDMVSYSDKSSDKADLGNKWAYDNG